jgi:hypothetical protein
MSYTPGVPGLCGYADATAVSGQLVQPAGLLLGDVEALNHFRHPEYRNRNVDQQGTVQGIATEGEFDTDFVETATVDGADVGTYAAGDRLFLADNGNVSRDSFGGVRPEVGRALGAVNSDGFLRVRIEL